jgi:hypothetical protein
VDNKSTALGPRPLAAPGGAAIAGVIFSVLMIISLGLVRFAVPVDLKTPDIWITEPDRRSAIQFALELVPFAGIAFLWFIGVLRNRMGELEDRFFASVFLGSGLLFVASMFGTAAVTAALIDSMAIGNISSDTYFFGHHLSDQLFNLFAMKMAGVFIFSTCTIGLRIALFPPVVSIYWLFVRIVTFAGYRQLEMDHVGVPGLDVAAQYLHFGGGARLWIHPSD